MAGIGHPMEKEVTGGEAATAAKKIISRGWTRMDADSKNCKACRATGGRVGSDDGEEDYWPQMDADKRR
jgi:hypothetical protein